MSLKLKSEEKLNKRIQNEFAYDFAVAESGLYVLEISGRAKNWWQNLVKFISFFQDDDLAVKIDGRHFPKPGGKRGWFDGPAAWNGNWLKNLQQINVFFVYLESGKHTLHFVADQSPLLETIKVYQAENERNIVLTETYYSLEPDNGRPWLCFVFIDVALQRLKIQARADQKQGDDDDLQLRINGERQPNDSPSSHRYWYWCGRALKGQLKTFDKKLNLAAGLNYIELWADKAPVVDSISLQFGALPIRFKEGRIALYRDIVAISKVAQLRREADHTKDNIIKALEEGTKLIILEERVVGTLVSSLSNIWHKVKVGSQEGFILSSFVEIAGQEREAVVNKIRRQASALGADLGLMIAVAGCESRYKPYAVSEDNARGIMQLTDLAIKQVAKSGFLAQDPFNPDQNIEAGIRYFLWIFNSFYKDTTQAVEKTVAAYNWKIKNVSEIFGAGPMDIEKLPEETARHVLCVSENIKKKSWKNIIWPMLVTIAVLSGSLTIRPFKNNDKLFANVVAIPTSNSYSNVFPCPRLEAKDKSVELIDQNCQTARVLTPHDLHAEEFLGWSKLNQDRYSFDLYHDTAGTMNAQQSRDGNIYFLLTTSGFCGSGGCGYVLYGYNTANGKITVIETDVDRVVRMLLSPNGKKLALASAAFHDICEANSYLRIIDLASPGRKIISGFEDQELPVTHIQNLQWLSDKVLMFSTLHQGDCDPVTIALAREKEFIYDVFRKTMKSRLIREYNAVP